MKLDDFIIEYPPTLIYSEQVQDKKGINFVGSGGKNNGVVSRVKCNPKNKLYKKGSITVPLKGSTMMAFVQPEDFYVAHQIAVLIPKKPMSLQLKQYYCLCLRNNAYRFSYGRQADRSLKNLELPEKIPSWVKTDILDIKGLDAPISSKSIKLELGKWKWFSYDSLFDIEKGYYNKRPVESGSVNFISASASNNGITDKIERTVIEKMYDGNCITIVNNGASTATAFYQEEEFTSSHDVNILRIKKKTLNPFIAMFLLPLFNLEKTRFSYGRKWRIERMKKTKIKLPVNDKNREPDWKFMEDYIKSLSYSSNLTN